jgi:hypothetical protein
MKRLLVIAMLFCAILTLTVYCVRAVFAAPLSSKTNAVIKETLVAEDVGNGRDIYKGRWCGQSAILYHVENTGLMVIDFVTGNRAHIGGVNDTMFNCSPDGRWVLYESSGVVKTENEGDMTFDEYVKRIPAAGVAFSYTYRHEMATGRKERVAVTDMEDGEDYHALSPDGKKVILGGRNPFNSEIYVPEWQPVWFSGDQLESYEKRWFDDSSGVASYSHEPTAVCVEFFGDAGWANCFEQDSGKAEISGLWLDNKGRIYFSMGVDRALPSKAYSIYGCDIAHKTLQCGKIVERDFDGYAHPIGVLANGDFLLRGDDCILRTQSLTAEGRCVANRFYEGNEYDGMYPLGISPDRKKLAIHRYRVGAETDGARAARAVHIDLFIMDLEVGQ